jgi:hypothetical protein
MSKVYCKLCGHRCHCVGQGYFVSSNQCGTCICDRCDHKGILVLNKEVKMKKWWKKFVDWLFRI